MNSQESTQPVDQNNPLAHFKARFSHPENEIYLDGNSLGKLPLKAKDIVSNVVEEQWGNNLIRSWNDHWLDLPQRLANKLGKLFNAKAAEIRVGESTSVNLYKLATALIQSKHYPQQFITDTLNFPTDNYILEGISTQLGIAPPIRVDYQQEITADIKHLKTAIKNNPGVVCLSLVSYKSAFLYPMKALNTFAKEHNSIIIWDLSHAAGAVTIDFKATETLAAIGCTYKYLNGGPGAPAFLYLDKSLIPLVYSPIQGWFGHAKPFDFSTSFQAAEGIEKFDAGTPTILSMAAMEVGIDLCLEAGIEALHRKSNALSSLFIDLFEKELVPLGYCLESPRKIEERGSHITLSHQESWRICQCLLQGKEDRPKIIPDFRPDYYVRFGITPLYVGEEEINLTVARLKEIVLDKEFEKFDQTRPTVT